MRKGIFNIFKFIISLCRLFVNNGFGDMKIKIENQEIITMKCFLCCFNSVFNSLIKDNKFNGCLELFEDCSINSYYLLEKYYSGGLIEINNNNCIELLKICVYYNEKTLLKECENYIIKHFNSDIMKKILTNEKILQCEDLKKLKKIENEYIKTNGYELLNESIYYYFKIF